MKDAGFLTPLRLEELPGGTRFMLTAPLIYRAKDKRLWVVPAYTETDFASVPRVLWNVLPPFGDHSKAAVLHDYLYQAAPRGISRRQADDLFRQAMDVSGVSWITRQTMWAGVRSGGWKAWSRYRKESPDMEPAA